MSFIPDLTKDHYRCHYCGVVHQDVEAGGIYHCPNPFCLGPGNGYFRSTLNSYKEVDNGKHVVEDTDEWFEAAFAKVMLKDDSKLRDDCLRAAVKSEVHSEKMGQWIASLNKETQMMNAEEIVTRFTYHKPTKDQPEKYEKIRDRARDLALMLNNLCPESRELSLALTKLEETVMWANAAIARRS